MLYKGILSKLSAAKELMREFTEREKRKQAEREAEKAAKASGGSSSGPGTAVEAEKKVSGRGESRARGRVARGAAARDPAHVRLSTGVVVLSTLTAPAGRAPDSMSFVPWSRGTTGARNLRPGVSGRRTDVAVRLAAALTAPSAQQPGGGRR